MLGFLILIHTSLVMYYIVILPLVIGRLLPLYLGIEFLYIFAGSNIG